MKTIGVIGGLSWHSTAIYYKYINEMIAKSLGGLHSANVNLNSLDFAPVANLMQAGEQEKLQEVLLEASRKLELMGVDGLVLANNTLHQLVPELEKRLNTPFIHIADALGKNLNASGISKIGLLGTAATMQSDFYSQRLSQQYQVETIIPNQTQSEWLNQTIFAELCHGIFSSQAKHKCLQIIEELRQQGAQGIALACTELPLLLNDTVSPEIPLIDTSLVHCQQAVDWLLGA